MDGVMDRLVMTNMVRSDWHSERDLLYSGIIFC